LIVATAVFLVAVSGAWAQALTARLDPSGMVTIKRGDVELAMIELNAHGPAWKHAPQATATAKVTDLPDGGKRFVGTLPIPNNTAGAVLQFTQSVKPIPQGLQLEYDLSVPVALKLNGLQFSLCLPTALYGGKALVIAQPDGDPQTVTLPAERKEQVTQVWAGEGSRVEVAKGTPDEIIIELRAAADAAVQDLRQWDRQVFEIRFPAIGEDPPREVTPEDRFHLDLTVTFGAPVTLAGP
jgi:hypothetical protein